MRQNSAKAFSLSEVLVVITIIVIISTLLMPLLGQVRESSKGVVCQSNLRQMYLGIAGYVQDWNGFMPQIAGWGQTAGYPQHVGARYLESQRMDGNGNSGRDVLKCPADLRPKGGPGPAGGSWEGPDYMGCAWNQGEERFFERIWSSYATSQAAFTPWGAWVDTNQRLAAISHSKSLMYDAFCLNSVDYPQFFGPVGTNRHRTGVNMMIADGRVSYYDFAPLKHNEHLGVWFWDPSADTLSVSGSMGGIVHNIGIGFGARNLNPQTEPWQ